MHFSFGENRSTWRSGWYGRAGRATLHGRLREGAFPEFPAESSCDVPGMLSIIKIKTGQNFDRRDEK